MKNVMLKNTLAEIRRTKSRFLSIFGIIAIGTGFFGGLLASAPDMRFSADSYYDRTHLLDYRLVSTYGFDDKDIEALKAELDGATVYPGYFTDAFINTDSGEKEVARVYSLDVTGENNPYNSLDIVEGRLPQSPDECIIDSGKLVAGYEIGDKIVFGGDEDSDIGDTLSRTEYTITGRFESSMYISDTERGNTTMGSGSVYMLCYIPAENFITDVYTQIVITSDELKQYNCYSDEYEQARDKLGDRIRQIADRRETERFDDIVTEAREELADAKKELDDAKKDAYAEIADGEKELADAKAELDEAGPQIEDARTELENGKKELEDGKKELDEAFSQIEDAREELESGKKELDEAKAEIDDARPQFEQAKKELDEAKKELDEGKAQLDASKIQLDENEKLLAQTKAQLDGAKTQLDQTKTQLDKTKALLDSTAAELEANQKTIDKSRAELEAALEAGYISEEQANNELKKLDTAQAQLNDSKERYEQSLVEYSTGYALYEQNLGQYNEGYAEYEQGKAQFDQGYAQYAAAVQKYENGLAQYESGLAEYEEGYATFLEGIKAYEEGISEYENGKKLLDEKYAQYLDGVAAYEQGVEEYENGKAEVEQKYAEYLDGLTQYEDGAKELDDAKAEAEKEFADAEKEIADAEAEINELESPEWFLFTRDDNPGYTEYGQNSERIKNIALVFPLFFVMVAALVCLTTMTRMVDEQRTQIGTLKALGYSNAAIISKYMIYALTASVFGAVVGLGVGLLMFPAIIIKAYAMMYNIDDPVLPYDFTIMGVTTAAAILLTVLTVYFSCKGILADCPASLMRPKTPKSGKKILLERITPVWNRLSFSHKVTMRNLFRYKRRMLMTVVGIAGCTALVLTGFGVYDSINDILVKQFDEISNYTGIVAYESDELESTDELQKILSDYGCDGKEIYQKQISVQAGDRPVDAYIFSADSNETISRFVTVKDRFTGEIYTVGDDGVIINEKLASLLGDVKKGDSITLSLSDTKRAEVTVSEICENYANHYVYLTDALYEKLAGSAPVPNSCFFNAESGDVPEDSRNKLASELMKIDGVMGVSFKTEVMGTFRDMLKSLLLVVVVLIVSAGALAFIVLYNLINININERIREIASLKVLGFYDKEVSMYVFREIILLTLLGTAAGVLFGRILVDFVIRTAEIDQVMFGREVHLASYLLSIAITLFFAVIVMLFMHKRLKNVDMVEALKSVE